MYSSLCVERPQKFIFQIIGIIEIVPHVFGGSFYIQNEDCGLHTGDGSVDINGKPVLKSNTGNWRACPFILGNLSYFYVLFIYPRICTASNRYNIKCRY